MKDIVNVDFSLSLVQIVHVVTNIFYCLKMDLQLVKGLIHVYQGPEDSNILFLRGQIANSTANYSAFWKR